MLLSYIQIQFKQLFSWLYLPAFIFYALINRRHPELVSGSIQRINHSGVLYISSQPAIVVRLLRRLKKPSRNDEPGIPSFQLAVYSFLPRKHRNAEVHCLNHRSKIASFLAMTNEGINRFSVASSSLTVNYFGQLTIDQ